MTSQRAQIATGAALLLLLYVSGGLVTFDDPSDKGFGITSFTLEYPALLPLLHRMLALVVLLVWLALTIELRGKATYPYTEATLALIVIQSAIGVFIAQDAGHNILNYLVLMHFSVSGLIIIAGGLAFIRSLGER